MNEKEDSSLKSDLNKIEVPDGGYGWVIVLVVFMFNIATWGANSGFSVYLAHYIAVGQFGATKLDTAAIGGLCFGSGMFLSPLIQKLGTKIGIKPLMVIGIILQSSGIILAAFCKKLWQVYLTQGLMIGLGMGTLTLPVQTLLTQWFRKKRSMALGLASAGSAAGGIMFNLVAEKLIQVKSVKWALIIQCILCSSLSVIALILTRTRYQHVKPHTSFFDKECFTNIGYYLVLAWCSFTMLGYVILLYSLADWARALGFSPQKAAIAPALNNVGSIIGRPIVGRLSDKFGPITVALVAHLLVVVFCWGMWIPARNYASVLVYSMIQGSMMGTVWPLVAAILTRVVGLPKVGVGYASVASTMSMFGMVAPVIGLQLRKGTGANAYVNTAIFAGFGYFGAALSLWALRGYIVARDREAKHEQTAFDDGEMHLRVTKTEWLSGLFSLRTDRLV